MANNQSTNYNVEQVKNYVKSVNWDKRLKKELLFLSELFFKHKYSDICDFGCGPGIHALEFAKTQPNFQITGLDIDQNMIDYAIQNAKNANLENLQFVQGNFLNLSKSLVSFKEKFDVLYSLGNAIMILWSNNEDLSIPEIFKKLSYFIKPGGGLFFQILNSDSPRDGHVVSKIMTNETGDSQMLIKHFLAVENKLLTTFSTITWNPTDPTSVKITGSRKGRLKLVPLNHLQESMEEAGFSNFTFYENYDSNPLQPNKSDSLMCFAMKV